MVDGTGTTSYTYDNANRLLTVTAPVTGTLTYTYDALGRRASLKYPGQTTPVSYAYTERGQLDTVTDWLSNVTNYGYDTAGRLTSIDYPNGVDATFGYDDANRLTSLDYVNGMTTLEAIDYTVNAAGIRTQMVDSSGTTMWGYDALYRLTSVDYPTGSDVSYTYDKVGNRETMTVGSVVTDYTHNTLNQLMAVDETDDGTDDITYGYDPFGNLTSKVAGGITTNYAWDALDRLTSVTSAGSTVGSYVYNGNGLRAQKTVGSTTSNYTWDPTGLGTVIQVDNGTAEDHHLWGPGLIGRIDGSGTRTYAHSDGLGSIRSISDGSGVEVGSTEYDAFGASRSSTGVSYAFGYTGEQIDAETGFVYLRARYYDPAQGRFLTKDPFPARVGDPGSGHRYAYVRNSATNRVDPSGMIDWDPDPPGDWSNPGDALMDVADAVGDEVQDVASTAATGVSWMFETGDETRVYGPDDAQTQNMMESAAADAMRQAFADGGYQSGKASWSTMAAVHQLYKDPFNHTQQQVGGFKCSFTNNGDGTVTYTFENTLSVRSFFYHFFYQFKGRGYPERDHWFPLMGNVDQYFTWTEPIPAP